jgi:hypothetical protein
MVAARPLEHWPAAMWSDEMSADKKVPHLRIHQALLRDIPAVLLVGTQARADRAMRSPDRRRDTLAAVIRVPEEQLRQADIPVLEEHPAVCRMQCWSRAWWMD